MTTTITLDGIPVVEEGAGDDAIVMVHGWPDTLRLWDAQVAALAPHYRCVRFTLPGFDPALPARAASIAQLVELIRRVVEHAGRGRPVTLLLHDWGCVFGYQFALTHPHLVARLIGVDVGDAGSRALARALTPKAKWMIARYQLWLAAAWVIGGAVGDWMTRTMARAARCPADPARIGARMNYPYAMRWLGAVGGMRGLAPLDPRWPMLYVYGERKPFMFHSPQWLQAMAARPGSRVVAMPTGHWVMVEQPDEFNRVLLDWLTPRTAA
jgi:pimeloyl-ACP methyl ester carboxylesterase